MCKTNMIASGLVAALICFMPAAALAQSDPGATTPAASEQPFQVVRAGDGAMTCEALIAEINALNSQVQALQMEMTEVGAQMSRDSMAAMGGGRGAAGMGMGLASAAAGFIPGAGLLTGAVMGAAQQASQAAMVARQKEIMERSASLNDNVMTMAPLANRAQHLSEISRNKGC